MICVTSFVYFLSLPMYVYIHSIHIRQCAFSGLLCRNCCLALWNSICRPHGVCVVRRRKSNKARTQRNERARKKSTRKLTKYERNRKWIKLGERKKMNIRFVLFSVRSLHVNFLFYVSISIYLSPFEMLWLDFNSSVYSPYNFNMCLLRILCV